MAERLYDRCQEQRGKKSAHSKMAPETVIRIAHPEDLPGIMQLQERSYDVSLHEPVALFERILTLSPATCFTASYDGDLTGYLLTYPVPDRYKAFGEKLPIVASGETTLYIHDLCVSSEQRGKGIARLLYDGMIDSLGPIRFKKIVAVAVQDSDGFWQSCGFEIGAPYTYPGGAAGHVISKILL
jgi:predicted GNAT superfamily acetyltransferase